MKQAYSVIDIETTGGRSGNNKITEIAIINIDDGIVTDTYSTLINPERNIPWTITRLTGIDNEMVANAPKFYEVAKKIIELTKDRVFVAHNVFFDYNFIKYEFNELGYQYKREKLCTVRLARRYLPGHKSYSLGKICQDLNIPIEGRHRALGDASATTTLFKLILEKEDNPPLIEEDSKKIALPSKLERNDYENLPSKPGIYYFYDEAGFLLYIGKSKEIKKRVSSHFRPDIKRAKDLELKNRIAKVTYKETGNELAALLLESHEIKTHRPHYNRALKRRRFPKHMELKVKKNGEKFINIFHGGETESSTYAFSNKRNAERKRDFFYLQVIGVGLDHPQFNQRKDKLIQTIGMDQFNKLLEKIFYHKVPQIKDFSIELTGRKAKEVCIIKIKDHKPYEISYYERIIIGGPQSAEKLKIKIKGTQDNADLIRNYMAKHGLKIKPLDGPSLEDHIDIDYDYEFS